MALMAMIVKNSKILWTVLELEVFNLNPGAFKALLINSFLKKACRRNLLVTHTKNELMGKKL